MNPESTATQLNLVHNHLNGDFVLTSDINLSFYKNWEPTGTVDLKAMSSGNEAGAFAKGFTGSFNGNNYTFSSLNGDVEHGVGIGLFGLSMVGTVTNLNIYNAVVKGEGDSMAVAAVVGYNMGTITNVNLRGNNSVTATGMPLVYLQATLATEMTPVELVVPLAKPLILTLKLILIQMVLLMLMDFSGL